MRRKAYSFNEMIKEIPELENFNQSTISDSIETVLRFVDAWAYDNGLELFQIITPNNDKVVFVFSINAI